jgi:hypothetical protein
LITLRSLGVPKRETIYTTAGFTNDVPRHLEGHTTFDLSSSRALGETLKVSVVALNLANRRFLLDNGQTFGGTHYAERCSGEVSALAWPRAFLTSETRAFIRAVPSPTDEAAYLQPEVLDSAARRKKPSSGPGFFPVSRCSSPPADMRFLPVLPELENLTFNAS